MINGIEVPTTGFAPVKDGQLYYEVQGNGYPLVLIHASCADHTMWQEQFKVLAPTFQVISYDRRGFGQTTANPLDQTVSFFDGQDLYDLLQHLNIKKAYLLGLSGGGLIALDFALAFPDKVAGLILASSGFSGFEFQATPDENALYGDYMQLLQSKEWEQLATLGAKLWVDGPRRATEPTRLAIRKQVYQWLLDGYHRTEDMVEPRGATPPAVGRLGESEVPTLVMWGDQDESIILAAGETLMSQIKAAQKVVFPDTAHMLNLERPEQFNQEVLDFLQTNR